MWEWYVGFQGGNRVQRRTKGIYLCILSIKCESQRNIVEINERNKLI